MNVKGASVPSTGDVWRCPLFPDWSMCARGLSRYRLMQRAIGDMSLLQKIDADVGAPPRSFDRSCVCIFSCIEMATLKRAQCSEARGYWKLFSKGIITSKFWNSVHSLQFCSHVCLASFWIFLPENAPPTAWTALLIFVECKVTWACF